MSDSEETSSTPEKTDKVDLSALQNITFGPQWSSTTHAGASETARHKSSRDGRGSSRDSHGAPPRRDRRPPASTRNRREQGSARPQGPDSARMGRGGKPGYPDASFEPVVDVMFYPEDEPILALSKAMKSSCRTYELFEVARLILEKPERFVVVMKRKAKAGEAQSLYCAQPSGMPFLTEDQALAQAVKEHLDTLFSQEEVEVEAPKGNFQMISRCGITGELLGPPNYHRYQHLLQEHHSQRLASMPYERFQSKVESVREQEVIDAWLAKMTKVVHYRLKEPVEGQPETFDSLEAARQYILLQHREGLVRALDSARLHGHLLEAMPKGDLKQSIEAARDYQIRFPLDAANNLRGRLRRLNFCIYKKGSKGISYVCAVKRKFRSPKTVFAEQIQQVFDFIEANPLVKVGELPGRMLDITADEVAQNPKAREILMHLHWLIHEGYVTEYGDSTLYAPPPLPEAKGQAPKKEPAEGDKAEEKQSAEVSAQPPESATETTVIEEETRAVDEAGKTEPEIQAPEVASTEVPTEVSPTPSETGSEEEKKP